MPPVEHFRWRSSDGMGLQHAVPADYHAIAVCGSELDYATTTRGPVGKPKCSVCVEILDSDGEMPRFW